MTSHRIPDDVKKNVRAVLLSKIGGVLVSELKKDYHKLVNQKLFIDRYGFESFKDFIEAMPEYARLEYSERDMAYRIFGVGDPKTYMSTFAKKAQGNPKGSKNYNGDKASAPDTDSGKLVPNSRGLFTVCFPIGKARTTDKDAIMRQFSDAGPVGEVNQTTRWIFIRYKTKEGALCSLAKFSHLDVRVASEGKNHGKDQQNEACELENDSLLVPKPKFAEPTVDLSQKNEDKLKNKHKTESGIKGDIIQVVVLNIDKDATKEVKELFKEYNPVDFHMSHNGPKWFAFLNFHSKEEAMDAVTGLNGTKIGSRPLQARLAKHDDASGEAKSHAESTTSNQNHLAGQNVNQNATFHEKPGLLGPKPDPVSMLNNSFDSLSSGNSLSLSKRLTDFSVHANHSGRNLATSTPLSRSQNSLVSSQQTESCNHPYSQGRNNARLNQRPELEMNMPDLEESMPDLEESIPDLEESIPSFETMQLGETVAIGDQSFSSEANDSPVTIFVANFPRGTTAKELFNLFFQYRPLKVEMMQTFKCPKAHIWLKNLEKAEKAIRDMNQLTYMDRVLLVDVPRTSIEVREKLINRGNKLGLRPDTSSNGSVGLLPHPDRMINSHGPASNSLMSYGPTSKSVSSSGTNSKSGLPPKRSQVLDSLVELQLSESGESDVSSLTEPENEMYEVLKTYSHILSKMSVNTNSLRAGNKIRVFVTSVKGTTFFWGQVVSDALNRLRMLVKELQKEDNLVAKTKGLGRCAALYQGEWHRAWILKTGFKRSDKVKVLFVDYGNVEDLGFEETRLTATKFWDLPPMARPFTVSKKGVLHLEKLENPVVDCNILQTSPASRGLLTEVEILKARNFNELPAHDDQDVTS